MTNQIILKRDKKITKTTIKKLLNLDETTVISKWQSTDDYMNDLQNEFEAGKKIKKSFILEMLHYYSIQQPIYSNKYTNEITIYAGEDIYTIINKNIVWQ